jgi:hypothetical protein
LPFSRSETPSPDHKGPEETDLIGQTLSHHGFETGTLDDHIQLSIDLLIPSRTIAPFEPAREIPVVSLGGPTVLILLHIPRAGDRADVM